MQSKVLETLIVLRAVDKASSGFRKVFGHANKEADAFARKQRERSARWGDAARASGAVALGIGAALFKPTQLAVNFEQAIANVGAVSGATSRQLVQMGEAARIQGRETVFTATESAGAMEYLAMAGLKAGEIITTLPGVLNLAAAGNLDLAQTADIATNVMSAFGMKVGDMTRIGNVLTRTFTSSNSTLETIAATMKYTGPIAKEAGLGLEEAAAMTGVLANAGIKGQMAGTSLRGMLLRLAGKTKPAAAALRELGINTVDSNGNLRDLTVVLQEMGVALDGVPSGRKLELIKTMFETEGTSGAAKLLDFAKDGGLAEYAKDIAGTGTNKRTAKGVADQRMETALGNIKKFRSATVDLGISLGNALLPTLTSLAEKASVSAISLSDWTGQNSELTATIVKAVAIVGGLATGLAVVSSVISSFATVSGVVAPALALVGKGIALIGGAFGLTGAAAIAVPLAVVAAIAAIGVFLYTYEDAITSWASRASKSIASFFGVEPIDHTDTPARKKPSWPPPAITPRNGMTPGVSKSGSDKPAKTPILGSLTPKPELKPKQQGGQTSINYAPTIHLPGASESTAKPFREMLREHKSELFSMVKEGQRNERRLTF